MVKITLRIFLVLFSVIALAEQTLANEAGFCPRLEGKRSGTCRIERPGSGCVPDMPCAPAPILLCEEESTFDMPIQNGGTCISTEERCTVTPEGRTCEQVCTKWDKGTCSINTLECCTKYKVTGEMKMTCCGGQCVPVGDSGKCGDPPPPMPGKKLPLCGSNGRCD